MTEESAKTILRSEAATFFDIHNKTKMIPKGYTLVFLFFVGVGGGGGGGGKGIGGKPSIS